MASVVPPALRLLAATAGIAFAVILNGPVGFPGRSVPERHSALRSHDGGHRPAEFPVRSDYAQQRLSSRRLDQAYAVDGVASTLPVYGSFVAWKIPDAPGTNDVHVQVQSVPGYLDLGAIKDPGPLLRTGDNVLFDDRSCKEYGDVPAMFGQENAWLRNGGSCGGGRTVQCGHFFRHRRGCGSQRREFLPLAAWTESGGEFRATA
jgi:hypothetical protein